MYGSSLVLRVLVSVLYKVIIQFNSFFLYLFCFRGVGHGESSLDETNSSIQRLTPFKFSTAHIKGTVYNLHITFASVKILSNIFFFINLINQ